MQIAETANDDERRRTVGGGGCDREEVEKVHGDGRVDKESKTGTSSDGDQQEHSSSEWKANIKGIIISMSVIFFSYTILKMNIPEPSKFAVITKVLPVHCGLKLSSHLQNLILDKHNEIRSKVALGQYAVEDDTLPMASNMEKLTWDCQLELEAQNRAAECDLDEKKGERGQKMDSPLDLDTVRGENSFYFRTAEQELELDKSGGVLKGIEQMGDEIAMAAIKTATIGRYDKRIGHATQIIWATTRRVGCAVQECSARKDGSLDGQKFNVAVCKYFPTGNVFKSESVTPIYSPGEPGTACRPGTLGDPTSGLCVETEWKKKRKPKKQKKEKKQAEAEAEEKEEDGKEEEQEEEDVNTKK
uniref:SCP domain-containing protein n=1 Tax=Caenorhabditis japonica TaxID=281687 RepID=A0A8R1HKW5_CAEJA